MVKTPERKSGGLRFESWFRHKFFYQFIIYMDIDIQNFNTNKQYSFIGVDSALHLGPYSESSLRLNLNFTFT